jgi:hypothetical protein
MDLTALFAGAEQKYGLPSGYLARTAQIESSMNPNAKNPNSSASGLFQFIDSTARDYGLTNPFDPVASTDAAARLAAANARMLTPVLGRAPTAGELYLAHQQGGGGAAALLRNPDASAASVVGNAAANLNAGAGLTAGQFAQQWTGKFGDAAPVMSASVGQGAPAAPYPTQNPTQVPQPQMAGAPASGGMLLGDIAAQYLSGFSQRAEQRRAEEEAAQARRTALFSGLGGLYG